MLATKLLDTLPYIMRQWRLELMNEAYPVDLTPGQLRVLFLIREGHNQCGLLSRHAGVSAAAMSRMIDGLVKLEWLERSSSDADRRQVTLSVTKKGEEMVLAFRKGLESRFAEVLQGLNSQEKKQVEVGLAILQKAFLNMSERS